MISESSSINVMDPEVAALFENYVDVNMYYDNLYIYSFLKYADPPLIGYPTDNFDDFLNVFFVEYNNDNLDITIGDVLTVYGRGLSLHTYQEII